MNEIFVKKFIKKPIVIASFIVILAIVAGYFYFSGSKNPAYEFAIAKRADIIQEVSVTGRVKPSENVDLAFEKSGKVSNIYVKVGDKVRAGKLLARLDNAELSSQLSQAQADVKAQEAKLDELKRGTREEEIKVQEVKVENAGVSLKEAKQNLIDKIQDVYTKSDDAIRNKVDQFFKSPAIPVPQIIFPVNDSQLKIDIEWERIVIEDILKNWKSSLAQFNLLSDLNSYLNVARTNLNRIKSFLDEAALMVNGLTASSNFSQTTIDSWRADVFTARTNINTGISNLSAAEEKLKTAEADLALSQQELVLEKAGTAVEEINAQEAQVEKAQADVSNYQAQINKTIIRSPIDGTVTKQDAKVGEIVSANTPVISAMSTAKFEIEANIPEADIAKVKIGDSAKITLDAYGEDVIFQAKVVVIEPAETIIEGVATYKTTLQFDKEDDRIKSGMTANIDILTDKRENAIAVPRRAVANRNGDKIVKILIGDNVSEVKVKTGLAGSDGNIEILEGIKEGDKIVTNY